MASFYGCLILLACVSSGFGQDNDKQPSCTTVKTAYRLKRLAESDVPQAAVDGDDLRVCPKDNGKQCCSQQMEVRFGSLAGNDFDKSASSKVREIRGLFNDQAKTFDDYFRGLIKKSQQDLHTMFEKIYGNHYLENTKIFMDLFVELTNYYNGVTNSDVSSIMNTFFKNLMRRMFEIMNGQFQFTRAYLDCVSRHMEKLAPFGDVPEKLTPQVRKVMIYARTFTQALHAGREVIHSLENAISSKNCKNQLIKMKYCSWCKAMTSLKPCFKFCTDVHKDCLADVAKVNTQWERYLTALDELLEKQAGATNIHDVMTRLHLKISFAIMNFQTEKSEDVRTKVFQAKECGSPGRTKRSTDDFFLEGNSRQRRDDDALARTSQVNLDRLTTNYKAKMKVADDFWINLPERMCGDISAKDKNSDCWNGVGKGSYKSPDDGGNNVEGDPTAIVSKAIAKLKELEDQLVAAKDGEMINVIDNDDDDDEEGSSGSGSGSGESGDNLIPENTETPSTSDNGIDDREENDNTLGGGVGGQPNAGLKKNTASRHAMGDWLLCSLVWVLSLALRA